MKKELELRDICGYLPHRLKITDDDGRRIYDLSNISLFQGIFKADICQQINSDFFDEGELYIGDLIPILRPLSDLYRTITHNGKEIIPIVELAKIAYPCGWYLNSDNEAEYDSGYDYIQFRYSSCGNGSFHSTVSAIPNQYRLFDFMNELKIDYRGLIDSGLAIDANTLETNPYK